MSVLLGSDEPEQIAELQWRLSIPLATVLLALLAVPLSKSQPREGRYGRITIGLLVFIIYFNMLSAAKAWIERGDIAPALGLWWVHGALLLLTVLLLAVQNGVHRRLLR
jgi:lipopolysaccharide export system permease protein